MISSCLGVNSEGHLTIGGADAVSLAREFGTPAYIFDENEIRSACRAYKNAIDVHFGGNGLALYASKAFSCKEIYRIVQSEGLGFDIVSGGELYTALSAGTDPEKIFFHGNNKTPDEIVYAVESGVGTVVVDNIEELRMLEKTASEKGRQVRIFLRIKPGIDAHTHDFVKTGQIDSKFGFALETGEAEEAVKAALSMPSLRLVGLHAHVASQIFDGEPFALCTEVMMDFIAKINKALGADVRELNLGGGVGVKYTEEDAPLSIDGILKTVASVLKEKCAALGVACPRIYFEPGRSIVASAGVTLYTVGSVKTIPGIRTFVGVDGGMGDNPRYALYGSRYEAIIANRAGDKKDFIATVAGRCCESGDLIGEGMTMQKPKAGDTLAVLVTGAYNYSMASNYNRVPRPPVIMVKDGKARIAVKRESYENIIENDI